VSKALDSIKYLLQRWGEIEAKPVPGLSYASDTIEARMIEYGGITSGSAIRTIPSHKADKQNNLVDQSVHCLDRQQKRIIYQKYVNLTPDIQCIEIAGLSKAAYYNELRIIYAYIAGSLGYSLR